VLARRPFYFVTLMAQCVFYCAALVGWALEGRKMGSRILRLPYYFSAANAASLVAVVNWVTGKSVVAWKTDREEPFGASDGEPK
jgi:biofilm PGA synthesis N-glycosyltransferase PgaC